MDGLVNYWPISYGLMNDIVGCAHMTQGNLTNMNATDHKGNANSALNLNLGYTRIPDGFYFNSAFTITCWIYPNAVGNFARLVDFGIASGNSNNNIFIAQTSASTLRPYFNMYVNSTLVYQALSPYVLAQNQWSFIAASFNGTMTKLFINSTLVAASNVSSLQPVNVLRTNNFVGKSQHTDGYSNSKVDELRIYNRCLSQTEIEDLMNN